MTHPLSISASSELTSDGHYVHAYLHFDPSTVGNFEPMDLDVRNAERRTRMAEGSAPRALAVALSMAVEYAGKGNTYDALRELDTAAAIVHADYERLTSAQVVE